MVVSKGMVEKRLAELQMLAESQNAQLNATLGRLAECRDTLALFNAPEPPVEAPKV